eukprot:TRINITY_DN8578_c0_g1_i2.p2 TRINITY_DN8578_c0_g1~~TRINITY_DN8578_c0_g1_i2.p2  ORF type:complete len:178 (+),score=27.02 TRINITY_DN8578_c0_g1_i2:27-536(+)
MHKGPADVLLLLAPPPRQPSLTSRWRVCGTDHMLSALRLQSLCVFDRCCACADADGTDCNHDTAGVPLPDAVLWRIAPFLSGPAATELYDRLGVAPGATSEQLKKAHRAQLLKYFPDRASKEQRAWLGEVSRAFGVLGNAETREAYDEYGIVPATDSEKPREGKRKRED